MSLKRNCDGCGTVISNHDDEHDYPDLVIYIGESETPTYEYEDLCPKCRDRIVCAIENALIDKEDAPHQDIEQSNTVRQDTEPQCTRSDNPISPETPSDNEEPAPNAEAGDERHYANGIVNQFPIKSMRANR